MMVDACGPSRGGSVARMVASLSLPSPCCVGRKSSVAHLRCRWSLSLTTVPSAAPLQVSIRTVHIDHSSDVHKWRSPEKEEVKRQFRGGVKLGSDFVKFREREEIEKRLIEEDKYTNWSLVYAYSLGIALLLIGLNLVMVFVKPNPSPEYVPYADPSASPSVAERGAGSASASSSSSSFSR
ncbi:hypothetical protein ABL78_0136 [Leptomonas seymouri]|uniref:Transmembrane protein n=1 Tax=Leptomonas seymouri TaxID=5684 RepID=A0A0N1IMU7_LEPSE|nr:hypothetical protein ABL78_0136 [Leptomonas seymouri]|eukprot:KPI90700.1 hypothetical protein ABL78_0136 [Leptomonas seymouri]